MFSVSLASMVEAAEARAPRGTYIDEEEGSGGRIPDAAMPLFERIVSTRRAMALAFWFQDRREEWANWWKLVTENEPKERLLTEDFAGSDVGNHAGEEGALKESLLAHLSRLTEAVDAAAPYKIAAEAMRKAWKFGKDIVVVEREQAGREQIAKALLPLKTLSGLAEEIARQAITELSDRIGAILESIHISERFRFYNTRLDRKEGIVVRGGFASQLRIDATLVANTSWLRAVLWAFLFALREEAIEQLGWDSFPLFLFDDPQATFDAEHRHRWAQYVAQLQSGSSKIQLILATFDETFLGLVKMDGITGRRALIAAASSGLGHVAVFEGNALDRKWDSVRKVNTAEAAREYLMSVRVHLEGMLKLMLRGEDPGVPMFTLNECRVRIKLLQDAGIPPWNNHGFKGLLAALDKGRAEIQYLEGSHHTTGLGFGMGGGSQC